MRKAQKISVVAAIAFYLCICSVDISGQEPVDSITISKYTEYDLTPESEFVILHDTIEQAKVYPLDTLNLYVSHSPAKAAIMSAVVPGLGQIYNKKYWKLPIVYAAIGISVERFITFQNKYNQYRRAYIDINDKDPYTNYHLTFGFPPSYSETQISQFITKNKETLRTWRDWSIVAMIAAYALNIIDANVDAHLIDFNLEDNISLNIRPSFFENDANFKIFALTLQFTF